METIDIYCEWLLKQQGNSVVTLPGGLSEKKYLERLDILITEMFSQLTLFHEQDYRCGKATLELVKKYCFSNQAYGNAPQAPSFKDYSAATLKMIDDELKRISLVQNADNPYVDPEKLFTIIANTYQLMTSVIAYHHREKNQKVKKEKARFVGVELPIMVDVQKEITFEREDPGIVDIIPYLDKAFSINDSFEKARNNANSPRKIIGEWAEFKYLGMILELSKIKLDELGVF